MDEPLRLTAGDVRLAYHVAGNEDAPPLVLLHALGERAGDWEPVLPALCAHYRVYALDLRGHGDSDWPGEYSSRMMRDDVLAFLGRLGLERVVLAGHSMGGVVAFLVAMARPGLVGRLIVEDVAPPYPRDRPIPERPGPPLDFDWAVVPAMVGAANAGDQQAWAGLASITAPTLLIGGGPGSHIPQDKLAEAAAAIPSCDLVTIPAGHLVHAVMPGRFCEVVLGWLGRPG